MVTRYWKVNAAPAGTVVVGQSARARSRPLNVASPPLHSFPSGIFCRSWPLTLGTRRLSQPVNDIEPPVAASAARQAADLAAVPPSGPHSSARLGGVPIAPCAWAGAAASAIQDSTAAADTAMAGLRRADIEAGLRRAGSRFGPP